jgi:hypothetical protein
MSTSGATEQRIARQVIDRALQDRGFARQLLGDPVSAFKQAGLSIPADQEAEFNENFPRIAPDFVATLNDPDRPRPDSLESSSGLGCTACMVAAEVLAGAIAAVGAAGLAELTEGSAVVVSVADFLGLDTADALAFVKGLGKDIVDGVGEIAKALCKKLGAC